MDYEGLESTNSPGHGESKVTGRSLRLGGYSKAHGHDRVGIMARVGIRQDANRSAWGIVGSRSRVTKHKPGRCRSGVVSCSATVRLASPQLLASASPSPATLKSSAGFALGVTFGGQTSDGHDRGMENDRCPRLDEDFSASPSWEQVSRLSAWTRKTVSQRKSGMECPKVGRGWGENNKRKKKGSALIG